MWLGKEFFRAESQNKIKPHNEKNIGKPTGQLKCEEKKSVFVDDGGTFRHYRPIFYTLLHISVLKLKIQGAN